MIKTRVVFIDSIVNQEFVNSVINENQVIKGIFTIRNNRVLISGKNKGSNLTHATMCAKKFLDNFYGCCEIYFIEILDDSGFTTNISSLLIALQWCLENEIDIINLSIGTTVMADMPVLYKKINRLIAKGVIIVSASSNNNKMTFPAYFPNIIGVRALYDKFRREGFEYEEDIDGIEINCYLREEIIKYNKKYYTIPCANSFAAPVISAKVCNLMNEGYNKIFMIRKKLKKEAITTNWKKQIKKELFSKDVNIPILEVVEEKDVPRLIQKLLMEFEKLGYHGICLSKDLKTDFENKIIDISDYLYNVDKILRFYNHYCDIDYIILHMGNNISELMLDTIDIIINNTDSKIYYCNDGTKDICVKTYKNTDEMFMEICHLLIEK